MKPRQRIEQNLPVPCWHVSRLREKGQRAVKVVSRA